LADRGRWPYSPVLISPTLAADSNIVTGLYQLCEDTGVFGCIGILFIIGYGAAACFWNFQRRPRVVTLALLVMIYMFLAWLPICAMSYYNYWYALPIIITAVGLLFFRFVPIYGI